jgi:hypothetical protein
MRFKLVGNQRLSPNADVSPSQLCAVCQGKGSKNKIRTTFIYVYI